MPNQLDQRDTFPSITLTVPGGGMLTLPEQIETPYAIFLFYRGHW